MTESYELRVMVEAEQAEFVELLKGLTPDQWTTPSLCDGWTVLEVVRHIAWHAHTSSKRTVDLLRFAATEVRHRRARVNQLTEPWFETRFHEENQPLSSEELIDWLAEPATLGARTNILVQLSELIIHQQDVRRPLGAARSIPTERLAVVLDYGLTAVGSLSVNGARKRAQGLRLVATDMTWFAGTGPEVRGSGEAIFMALNGRKAALDDLLGDGLSVLSAR